MVRLGERANFMYFGLDSDASERDLDNASEARKGPAALQVLM